MKRTYLVLIITMFVIGFAAVSTTLNLNGTINFGFNKEDFISNVVFTYVNSSGTVKANISEDKKTIEFESVKLEDVGQKTYLKYDIANKSNQYDAEVQVSCSFKEDSTKYSQWLKIENDLEPSFKLEAGQIETGNLTVTLTKAYNDGLDDTVNIKCEINASPTNRSEKQEYVEVEHNYEEVLLQGADPVLEVPSAIAMDETTPKKLVPVKIDAEGKVTKADIKEKWYDYEHQEWANAVILVDGATEPETGGVIQEKDIESYFVWIPKYRYKLWNVDTNSPTQTGPFIIEVEFGTENTTDEQGVSCATPISVDGKQALSGETKECNNGEWMTHPAFITMGVNGFWVGKFEVGYKDAKSKTDAEVDSNDSSKVIVKPNVYSWRNMTNENMFNALINYATNLDSHMMKNTEWGAVAYLSHSKYGINDEVAQNTLEFKTGYGNTNDESSTYDSEEGFKASTTGNITGVYDMSGGTWERMAAYRDVVIANAMVGGSGFTKEEISHIDKKYFDVYNQESTRDSYSNRILGDATGELGPFSNYKGSWYQDYSDFIDLDKPWFGRSGYFNDNTGGAGQFNFDRSYGGISVNVGSRLVLSPK